MDMAREEVRNLNYNEFTETKSLDHASQQARQRNYQDFLIVDVDSHHYENEHYKEVYSYIESPVMRHEALESINRGGRSGFLNSQVGYQGLSGRITRHNLRKHFKASEKEHRDTRDGPGDADSVQRIQRSDAAARGKNTKRETQHDAEKHREKSLQTHGEFPENGLWPPHDRAWSGGKDQAPLRPITSTRRATSAATAGPTNLPMSPP